MKKQKALETQHTLLENDFAEVQIEYLDLFEDVMELQQSQASDVCVLPTKVGRTYTAEIRTLYYSLLAAQIPASKVDSIIKSVVKCFQPSINVDELKLPKKSCASYMRKEELKTICNAHKATVICKDYAAKQKGLHLNTDGTTKHQKKLGGVVVNDMVLSVNELPDGKANSAINDISREFEKLRTTARALGLSNAESINWTLIKSSTSDSASTQKKMNKLIDICRQEDEEKYGTSTAISDTIDLVQNFCSMHLGINLRKAFLSGLMPHDDDNTDKPAGRKHLSVDVLVHEFCKLFGRHGVPEYTCGVVSFPDFLNLMINDDSVRGDKDQAYYRLCSSITLYRQVGSRYFVSAANACKILLIRQAAIEFLKFTRKHTSGNKLERDIYEKLQNSTEISQLKADGLMYYHVYSDLTILSKSNILGLSALSMNHHYLELQVCLSEVEKDPSVALDSAHNVFLSEPRLYGSHKKTNHRLKPHWKEVYRHLFEVCHAEESQLSMLLAVGVAKMRKKLCSYAEKQLPGGEYWDPEPEVRELLCQLSPSNDVCESILGLNDYLTTAIPNLHQMARSNLVQVKKNKTLAWLRKMPCEEQVAVIDYAVKQRPAVLAEHKLQDQQQSSIRLQNMVQENLKQKALEKKQAQEKERLSQLHLITTSQELAQAIAEIDSEPITAPKRRAKTLALLKTQIQIRKKVLNQVVRIPYTVSRKQRPISEITQELSDLINRNTSASKYSHFIKDPKALVGHQIKQKFVVEEDLVKWYNGIVVKYCPQSRTYEVEYEGDNTSYSFDLIVDILNDDLIIESNT